jgi:hypothetical protein
VYHFVFKKKKKLILLTINVEALKYMALWDYCCFVVFEIENAGGLKLEKNAEKYFFEGDEEVLEEQLKSTMLKLKEKLGKTRKDQFLTIHRWISVQVLMFLYWVWNLKKLC